MSDFFADTPPSQPRPPRQPGPAGRPPTGRPRPLVLTIIVMAVLIVLFSIFAGIWTEKLWFDSLEYKQVFNVVILTRIGMFVGFGLLMALIVGANMWWAYRGRPTFVPRSPDQANLERYRDVLAPIRKVVFFGVCIVFAIFAGSSASGHWRTFQLWRNRESFGATDDFFNKDIGFYVFTLPWMHWIVDFLMTAFVIGLAIAVVVHYLFGNINLQSKFDKVAGPTQVQVSILLGILVLLKGADYYLDRFDLTSEKGTLITGMTYARDNAVLPSKNILMAIAVVCALLFFANVFRRTWMLPVVGLGLFALSAVLLGMVWPAMVQQFQVLPNEPDRESSYIEKNIAATRTAYGLDDAKVTDYDAQTTLSRQELRKDAASLPGVRLVDPAMVSETFEQLQQVRGYYNVAPVLDVDRYVINGEERDLVVAARELNLDGLPDEQKNWPNEATVYTHGYGVVAAFGNQRNIDDKIIPNDDGEPLWAERDIPPRGVLSGDNEELNYRPQIYFGENSPTYSIVGKPPGGKDVELDFPEGSGTAASRVTTYDGKDGVGVGNLFRKALYAVKFGEPNFILSSRVHANSKVLYDRNPRERLQKVAPWLTVDNDALPAVVDGKIVWILDGYTATDKYPLSEKKSMSDMTSDAFNPRATFATLPTDEINYIRNSVKATVDAYDGTVTLYAWDDDDPILKAWMKVFPDIVKPKSEISEELFQHIRYPEDLFKVQRNLLAAYHVTDPKSFYEGNDLWRVPEDPNSPGRNQPPYRLTVATVSGSEPVFSLTSVYTPNKRQNLASFISIGADATDPDTYGKFQILRLPDTTQVPGPSQISNQFNSDDGIAATLLPFKRDGTRVISGNLLTLPVGNGLLYVQPIYTLREGGSGNYPVLRFVQASFGKAVGIGPTLADALDGVLGEPGAAPDINGEPADPEPDDDDQEQPPPADDDGDPADPGDVGELSQKATRLLQRADQKFTEAEAALQAGNLSGYADAVEEARELVQKALSAQK